MANISKTTTNSTLEFEPYCEWQREEGVDTLIVHLPDFKKDQLRVQVNNLGALKISGERPENEEGTKKRFSMETKVPQDCNTNSIQAKFKGGRLHVVMPKKRATPSEPKPQDQPASKAQTPPENAALHGEVEKERPREGPTNMPSKSTVEEKVGLKGAIDELGSSIARIQMGRKVAVSAGVAVAVAVAFVAYAAYKYSSSSSPPPPSSNFDE